MKILYIHTYYQQRGGEDVVFEQDFDLLQNTEEVSFLSFRNRSGWKGGLQFILSLWNIFAARKLKKEIARRQPDIIHMHNLHFGIGPIAIRVAKNAGIPVMLTLHNYRLLSPSGILSPADKSYIDSVNGKFPWKFIRASVYRNSFLQTFWLALVVWFHKKIGTWQLVDKYIVHTPFSKELFTNSSLGIPKEKFLVNPNFVRSPVKKLIPQEDHFLFIGRLSREKGITVLLDTFRNTDYKLKIAGDGPLKDNVLGFCQANSNVQYLGRLDKEGVLKAMEQCSALIFPSLWYEGMPITILEAFSMGVPVIASDTGAMSDMIKHGLNGLLFDMGNGEALKTQLKHWNSLDTEERNKFSANARKVFEEKYNPASYKVQIMNFYSGMLNINANHELA